MKLCFITILLSRRIRISILIWSEQHKTSFFLLFDILKCWPCSFLEEDLRHFLCWKLTSVWPELAEEMFYNFLNNLSPASTDEPTQKLSRKTLHHKNNKKMLFFCQLWTNYFKIVFDVSRDRIAGGGGSCPVQWHDAPKQIWRHRALRLASTSCRLASSPTPATLQLCRAVHSRAANEPSRRFHNHWERQKEQE